MLEKKSDTMKYNFDEIIPRKGTNCVKHDGLKANFGADDILPMWVADMDFRSPDFVMKAIRERCEHEVLGYAVPGKSYWETICDWMQRHYKINASCEELHFIPGIVAGISFAIQALTQPGDSILILTPVYPPFVNLPQNSGRRLVCSPLKEKDDHFCIDFADLEKKAQRCKMMILSNPHNPVGTVWSKGELQMIADICQRNGMILISDEIHADLTLSNSPLPHTSFSTIGEAAKACSITFIAPSKTFNIAGLGSSVCYIPNEELRKRYFAYLETYEVALGNIFAYVGAEAAFKEGEEWLNQMKEYLQGNVDFLLSYCKEYLPKLRVMAPEASYLAWLDFSNYNMSHDDVKQTLIEQAKVALNDGRTFSPNPYDPLTECRFRLNIGCPRQTLEEALRRIASVFEPSEK